MAKPPTLTSRLLEWFDRAKRDLPWRRNRDPHAILVSEVMLQQTRVEAVIPYFERFLARFPTVQSLADAPLDEVLAAWAGLGYYRRARLLKSTAEAIARDCGGKFPRVAAELIELPGIGPYTAGAIASIAFGERTPLVDGNVSRVLARLFRIAGDPRARDASRAVWAKAAELVPEDRPGDFNQSLMELGATVCLPKNPLCDECPLESVCEARRADEVERFPSPRARREPVPIRLATCVVRDHTRYGVVRRATATRMGGLYDLPSLEIEPGADARAELTRYLRSVLGIEVGALAETGAVKHAITHHRITVEVFVAPLIRRSAASTKREDHPRDHRIAARPDAAGIEFVERFALAEMGFSALGRKALRLLDA